MDRLDIIRYDDKQLQKVSNTIAITNKLLALVEPQLIPYRKKDKWGFCTPDKQIVIDCIYDGAEAFAKGVAHVTIGRKGWGAVNKKGDLVIPIEYDRVTYFSEGLAVVLKNHKWGFIDSGNSIILPFIYDIAFNFSDGIAYVRLEREWTYIDKSGNKVDDKRLDSLEKENNLNSLPENSTCPQTLEKDGESFLVDKNGIRITTTPYDFIGNRGEGFCYGLIDVELDEQMGFIDECGNEIVPCIYDEVLPYTEGLAAVLQEEYWGFIDTKGNQIIPMLYDEVTQFENGISRITNERSNWQDGYIDKNGTEYWED